MNFDVAFCLLTLLYFNNQNSREGFIGFITFCFELGRQDIPLPKAPGENSATEDDEELYEQFEDEDDEHGGIYDTVEDYEEPEGHASGDRELNDLLESGDEGEDDETQTKTYIVLAQADICRDYNPGKKDDDADYLALEVSNFN